MLRQSAYVPLERDLLSASSASFTLACSRFARQTHFERLASHHWTCPKALITNPEPCRMMAEQAKSPFVEDPAWRQVVEENEKEMVRQHMSSSSVCFCLLTDGSQPLLAGTDRACCNAQSCGWCSLLWRLALLFGAEADFGLPAVNRLVSIQLTCRHVRTPEPAGALRWFLSAASWFQPSAL